MTIAETAPREAVQWPETPNLAAPIAAIAMALTGAPSWAARAGAAVALAFMMVQDLRRARFSSVAITAFVTLAFAQAGLFVSLRGGGSIWLALAVYTVASSAADFAAHRNPRSVILLGSSLALAQTLDPMGGIIAALMLPVCAGLPRSAPEARRTAGLYALLLFIHAMMAVLLAYLNHTIAFDPARFLGASIASGEAPTHLSPAASNLFFIAALITCAPALWLSLFVRGLRRRPGFLVAATASVVTIAAIIASLRGSIHDPAAIMAAIASCSIAAIASWRKAHRHTELALAACALAAVVSWLLLNALPFFGG
jgi:hypothetical protein